ncbi:hypothetical protein ACP70R_036824 [Stipagrostis hirtigluma subsp. patula]
MAAPSGGISIDWRQVMPADSPPPAAVFVGSSASAATPHPSRAACKGDANDGSTGDGDGGVAEFEHLTDQQLENKIKRWGVNSQPLLERTPDGGAKMVVTISRMKKELDRRRAARQRKDDTVGEQAIQAKPASGSRGDPFGFSPADKLLGGVAGKYNKTAHHTSSIKNVQVKGAASSNKKPIPLSQVKRACLKETHGRHTKSTDSERLNMGDYNTDLRRKATLKSCTTNRQKNNTVVSKGTCSRLHEEDATFGSGKRWECSKNKASSHLRFKKNVVLLDDDDDDTVHDRSADVEIPTKWDDSKIFYPSRAGEFVELIHSDMKCLEPEEYLNVSINVSVHPDYGNGRYLKNSRPRGDLYIFNTYFYSKLEEELPTTGQDDLQFHKLRRWWRNVDIFKKAYIILPINATLHWSLIIVCMPTKETDLGPIMLHLDSLGLHDSRKIFDTVARYLEAEWRHLQRDSFYDIPFSGAVWNRLSSKIDRKEVEVPRQLNEYDCGLFMLYYVDMFIKEAPERMTKQNLHMFDRKWFNPKEPSGLREGIRALLIDVFQSAREDDGPSQPESRSGNHSEGEEEDMDTVIAVTLD